MKCLASVLIIGIAVLGGCAKDKPVAAAHTAPVYTSFGLPASADATTSITVEELLGNPKKYQGSVAKVSGTVTEVCAKKGCWVKLADAKQEALFVKFTCPISGRLIPMEAVGKPAIVQGRVLIKEIDEEQARHYAADGGATEAELAKIVGPQKQITVAAPSAQIADLPTK